jgi:uncharacterized protein YdaU (DUF1376 family)
MKVVSWYPDQWAAAVERMSAEARGVYITLLNTMYIGDGPIEDNDQINARVCQVSTRKFRGIKAELLADGKLVQIGKNYLFNEKAEKTLKKAEENSEKQREKARKKWIKIKEKIVVNSDNSQKTNETVDPVADAAADATLRHKYTSSYTAIGENDDLTGNPEILDRREHDDKTDPELVCDAMGVDIGDPGCSSVFHRVEMWKEWGAILAVDVIPVIQSVRQRKGAIVKSAAYFDAPIREAIENRKNPKKGTSNVQTITTGQPAKRSQGERKRTAFAALAAID